ncbi:relaxase/mobilization nuclease domain-containing protein [Streptomyces specialis]|uniref:relaxase/mobilization nuclease domain-containing protein n=1 Tax=Streptomyces specialis TaxID=498367 RepID=UPI00073EA78F|nr:hypothetical protein [Streptomyces specialis]
MIPKIRRGSRTHGLLAYLYGPGKRDEHTDPHLVGSWDGFAPDPGRDPDATLAQLAAVLDLRVKQAGTKAPAKHVWHCSARTAPEDRHLTDEEWGDVARRLVTAAGLAPDGDPDGCRWVAVRHADDHIHILATTVRGDLRLPRMNYDFKRAQAECRRIERDRGLRRLNPGDGTAAKTPPSAERFKADRTGRPDPPRQTLREAVRQAVAGATTEEEFLARLREAGLRIKLRHAPSGDLLGYAVALPGDRNANNAPIWFAGSTLAPDLSLPKIRNRLTPTTDTSVERSSPAEARRHAAAIAEPTPGLWANDERAAAHLIGIGELLDATASTSPATSRTELTAAARAFARATRSHIHAAHQHHRALRMAAHSITQAGAALGRGEDDAAAAMLLSTLVLVTLAAARWHTAHGHAQQAAASRQAADHLRTAYRQAATTPLRALHDRGQALPQPQRRTYESLLRTALSDELQQAGADPTHPALLATLAHAQQTGHAPETLLHRAVAMRELHTADNINEVLIWRLHRLADLKPGPAPKPWRSTASPARAQDLPARATPRESSGAHHISRPPSR